MQHKTREMFKYPQPHYYEFGFGLTADDSIATKRSTIQPYVWQDNAIVDYETVKTNPENADFAVKATATVAAGSTVGNILVDYIMYIFPSDTEISMIRVNTMPIHTSMLSRLEAFDKKTGNDVETILELTHETTDEQTYPLFNGTDLFQGSGVRNMTADQLGLTTDLKPEGVAFDKDMYFNALHYYTNKEMLRKVTGNMLSWTLTDPLVNAKHAIAHVTKRISMPICKFGNPYMFCGELFHVPPVGALDQFHLAAQTTAIEHVTVAGRVRFNEYNPDYNFSRA